MLRVVHVLRSFWPNIGGVETCVADLATFQKTRGMDVSVVTLSATLAGARPDDDLFENIPVKRLKSIGRGSLRMVFGLLDEIKDADIVHVHNVDYLSEYLGITKPLHGKPLIVTTHGGYYHGSGFRMLRSLRRHTLSAISLRACDHLLCTGQQDVRLFGNLGRSFSRSPNAIRWPKIGFAEVVRPRSALVCIGRLARHKRIDLLLGAMALLRESTQTPQISCEVIGPDSGSLTELKKLARLLGLDETVHFRGELTEKDLIAVRQGGGIFVNPSDFESFGMTLLENMSFGKIAIASDIEAHQELIDHGATGFLANFHDPQAAATILREVISMPDAKLRGVGGAARAFAFRFDSHEVYEKVLLVYDDVLRQRTR